MPQGQYYPGAKLNEAPLVSDSVITYNAGLVSNTPAVTTPTVPGSGTAATNTTGVNCLVYIRAGTVSTVTVAGATLATATAGSFFVPAGAAIAVTYTSVPTWVWQAM